MSIFATEIPVSPSIDRDRFAAQAIVWVKGMPTSTLFEKEAQIERFEGEATFDAPTGEKLTLRECPLDPGFCIGARHEIPDDEGRVWRSEVILTSRPHQSWLRARTQCILAKATARLQLPRKPYFLKIALADGWPATDGDMHVSSVPKLLKIDEVDLASNCVLGKFDTSLPVVYVSRPGAGERGLSQAKIDNLAFRLGGVAHVVVEPSREFSKRLQANSSGRNPYGGAIGVCIPGVGVSRRFMLGRSLSSEEDLIQAIQDFAVTYLANRIPKHSLEWQDLLEDYGRRLRSLATSSTEELEIWNQLRNEENSEKDEQIKLLKEQISSLQLNTVSQSVNDRPYLLPPIISDQIGREIYEDEFSDRILFVLRSLNASKIEIDPRTRYVIGRVGTLVRFSGGAAKLEERIKAAGRDSSRADERLGEILTELGFDCRTRGGHPVYTPLELPGVGTQTLSSSSSDQRAGRNAAQHIIRDLAIPRLRD